MAAVSQTTFSNAFCWMKMLEFLLRFHWSLFLRVQLTIIQQVQIIAWRRSGDKPLSESMMVTLLTHICVTRPQGVNPYHVGPWGPFQKCLRGLKFSSLDEIHIFQWKIFCMEFQSVPLKFHTKYLIRTLRDMIFIQNGNLKELLDLSALTHFWNAPRLFPAN